MSRDNGQRPPTLRELLTPRQLDPAATDNDFGDPAATPRFQTPHGARRLPPIFRDGPRGPWAGRVEVVPVEMRRGVAYEVTAEWGTPERPAPGLGPLARPSTHAIDSAVVADVEHARGLAVRALELLADRQRPGDAHGLAHLAVELFGPGALYRT